MRAAGLFLCASALTAAAVATRKQQVLRHEQFHAAEREANKLAAPKRVAIIGAGAAGTSTAYHLRKFADEANIALNITVVEKNGYIGGRSTTVHVFDSGEEPVELGASIFVAVNSILVNATLAFNLKTQPANAEAPTGYTGPTLGIWDGEQFVFEQRTESGLWDTVKLFWRYGLAPVRTKQAVASTVGTFLRMYEPGDGFPWSDLTEEAARLGLLEQTAVTGEQWLKTKGVGDLFAREVVQAATRVNYAQNIGVISGLECMVGMAPEGAMRVEGGNWRIFSSMAKYATKDIRLRTTVRSISQRSNGSYILKIEPPRKASQNPKGSHVASESFDEVVIAAPFQYTDLSITPSIASLPEEIPYVTLHVTLFTTPLLPSPSFFKLKPGTQAPLVVLTTLPPQDHERDTHKATYAGKAGFFSISLLRPVTNPSTSQQEYLYKVFSPTPMTPAFLASFLSVETPKSLDDFRAEHVSWHHLKKWKSYPVEYPRVTFDKIALAPGLWYTGAMDSFISTMETNALMGMNVARLMVDKWAAKSKRSHLPVEALKAQQQVMQDKAKL